MLRPPASKPLPIIVTGAPTAAQEGAIAVIVPAFAAGNVALTTRHNNHPFFMADSFLESFAESCCSRSRGLERRQLHYLAFYIAHPRHRAA